MARTLAAIPGSAALVLLAISTFYGIVAGDRLRALQFGLLAALAGLPAVTYAAVQFWRGAADFLRAEKPPPRWPYSVEMWWGCVRFGFAGQVFGIPAFTSVSLFGLVHQYQWPWAATEMGAWYELLRVAAIAFGLGFLGLMVSLIFFAAPRWLVPPWLRERGGDISRLDTR